MVFTSLLFLVVLIFVKQHVCGMSLDLDLVSRESKPYEHLIQKRSTYVYKQNSSIAGFSKEEKRNIVDAHNKYRRTEPASNMQIMTWNDELESLAQNWSMKCDFSHNPNRQTSKGKAGENLALRSPNYNEESSIQDWFDEIEDYNYDSHTCTKVCGHYTQVVWSRSNEIGCGISYCETVDHISWGNAYILVCNYLVHGNYAGVRPYTKGRRCSECPEDMKFCINGLCSFTATASGFIATPGRIHSFLIILSFMVVKIIGRT